VDAHGSLNEKLLSQILPMPRLDRLLTMYCVNPLRAMGLVRMVGIPVLMYHSVSEPENNGRHPYYETAIAPKVFAEQMRFLFQQGYRTISLDQAVQYARSGAMPSAPCVVLTFDDGFEDFYQQAFPILTEFKYVATVYLPTQFIGEERCQFKKLACLNWAEVRELHANGVTFGSHTSSHQQLATLSNRQIQIELQESKEIIEDKLGCPVESFSYPYAFPEMDQSFKAMLRDMLVAQGYKNGVTTVIGTAWADSDAFFLPRLPVNSWDDLPLFSAKLEGCYDWLRHLQRLKKLVKPRAL
jgi:peptidoglycan/xylan/chitin deacetylase (PgdA/CDA1 family)